MHVQEVETAGFSVENRGEALCWCEFGGKMKSREAGTGAGGRKSQSVLTLQRLQ